MTQNQIPIVSFHDFHRLAEQNPNIVLETPLIVEGYISSWPEYHKWQDLKYLKKRFGNLQGFARAPNFITNRKSSLISVKTTFNQYMDYINNPDDIGNIYSGQWINGDAAKLAETGLPLYCGNMKIVHHANDSVFKELDPLLPAPLRSWNHALPYYYSLYNHFWLLASLPGALTPLHIDNNGTIATIAQLKGKKRVTLFAPDDLCYVHNPDVGFLDPLQPDEGDFPNWRRAVKWVADLNVDQVLFVGTNWSHHVETLETSISVSLDYVDQSNLDAYASSTDWASVLGDHAKSSPDLFVERTKGEVSNEKIRELPSYAVGRDIMAYILGATSANPQDSEIARIRGLYLDHIQRCTSEPSNSKSEMLVSNLAG